MSSPSAQPSTRSPAAASSRFARCNRTIRAKFIISSRKTSQLHRGVVPHHRSTHATPRASAHSDRPRSASAPQLHSFVELMLVWQQLASRMALPSGAPGPAHLILSALKLAVSALRGAPPREDGRPPAQRAIMVAYLLADLSTAGVPLDAAGIAAAVLSDAVATGRASAAAVEAQLGRDVAELLHDVMRVRDAPLSVDLYDDLSAGALREMCLAMHDVRALVVEIVCKLDALQHAGGLPLAQQHILALEVMQIYAPMGHALGLNPVVQRMEEKAFTLLFPSAYAQTARWAAERRDRSVRLLHACSDALEALLRDDAVLRGLGVSASITVRTKSLMSIMKKLLNLPDFSKGGRELSEVYDVLGVRVVLTPAADAPEAPPGGLAEGERCERACFRVEEVVAARWRTLPERRKDYISAPKRNGYRSLHLAVVLTHDDSDDESDAVDDASEGPLLCEMQIRSAAMHLAAEQGDAAHFAYKGRLEPRQAVSLKQWTTALNAAFSLAQMMDHIQKWDDDARAETWSLAPNARGADGVGSSPHVSDEAAARALFNLLDLNNDGRISTDELQALLTDLGEESPRTQAQALLRSLLGEAPADQEVTFEDLLQFQRTLTRAPPPSNFTGTCPPAPG